MQYKCEARQRRNSNAVISSIYIYTIRTIEQLHGPRLYFFVQLKIKTEEGERERNQPKSKKKTQIELKTSSKKYNSNSNNNNEKLSTITARFMEGGEFHL